MAQNRLKEVASVFQSSSESLHDKFLAMLSDTACKGCQSAGFGHAILAAWLQTRWSEFTRDLVVASVLATSRTGEDLGKAGSGVASEDFAERIVKVATSCVVKRRGLILPVWHAPWFVIEVSAHMGLTNLQELEATLGPTVIPDQISSFRNYLVHPGTGTHHKYERLQAKLGMLGIEPEDLLRQQQKPGLPVFTAWVRQLQSIAYDSTR